MLEFCPDRKSSGRIVPLEGGGFRYQFAAIAAELMEMLLVVYFGGGIVYERKRRRAEVEAKPSVK